MKDGIGRLKEVEEGSKEVRKKGWEGKVEGSEGLEGRVEGSRE